MQRHFSRVASAYRDVRTTDIEPILFIKEKLGGRDRLRAGDIGCGAGRYGRFILEHLPLSGLTCIDANTHMLKEAKNYLDGAGSARTHFLASRSENLPLLNDMFDCLFTFNAVHHFDLGGFLHQTGAALKKSGWLCIYTRLPEQNEASIWGKYFPGFRISITPHSLFTHRTSLKPLRKNLKRTSAVFSPMWGVFTGGPGMSCWCSGALGPDHRQKKADIAVHETTPPQIKTPTL